MDKERSGRAGFSSPYADDLPGTFGRDQRELNSTVAGGGIDPHSPDGTQVVWRAAGRCNWTNGKPIADPGD